MALLSPRVIDSIAAKYRRKEIRRSLVEELLEIRFRLAMVSGRISMRNGTITQELLKWQLPIVKGYKGFYADPKWLAILKKAAEMTDQQLQAASTLLQSPNRALGLKKFMAPYLTAHLAFLHLFPIEFERQAREFAARLTMLNEDIDQAWFFFTKTFDTSLDPGNLTIVKDNLEGAYSLLGQRSRDMAISIGQLLGQPN